ncbi:unnamed protein product [Nippostrongylus brasiliensis]|uniref:Interferon n=1 Tax=Nippostrongylus brasiliensis TaxID=27835 RepID=A0A0N4Y005_NIPBR|nr:unnamed protein product [Nippostrongylus brasiliensis]
MVSVRLALTVASVLCITVAAKIRLMPNLDCKNLPNDSDSNSSFCNFVNYTHNIIVRIRQSLNESQSEFALSRVDETLVKLFNSTDSQDIFDLLTEALDVQLFVSLWLEEECPEHFIRGKEYKSCKKMNRDFSRSMMSLVIAVKEAVADRQIKDKIADLHKSILGKNGTHRSDRQKGMQVLVTEVLQMIEKAQLGIEH